MDDLVRSIVEHGIQRYFAARRDRIPAFVDRHFSLRGTIRLHRHALGWDVVRAPANITMAAPAAILHLTAAAARRLGLAGVANGLSSTRLLLRTAVADRMAWLVSTELLELPRRSGNPDAMHDALAEATLTDLGAAGLVPEKLKSLGPGRTDLLVRRRLERTLAEYAVTRAAAAEVATAMLNLSTGAFALGKLTPGAVSFGPILASAVAQQAAVSSFPLGAGLGALWYGLFPATPSSLLVLGLSIGLLAVGSAVAAFAGIIADPIQRRLGLHQRRLRRMLDSMERQMLDPAAPGYAACDRYVARLLDALDLITAAYRILR